jgi:hypothetical protein
MGQRFRFFCCGCGANAAASDMVEIDEEADCGAGAPKGGDEAGTRQLSWPQVERMTGGFTSAVVGEGGFSTVYLARLSGALAAVKVHRSSERLHRVFRQELETLLRIRHPHIVRLLAFCEQQGPFFRRASSALWEHFLDSDSVSRRGAKLFWWMQMKACLCWSSRRTGTCTRSSTAGARRAGRCRGRGG